jgi:acyl-ACP thioesterase
MWVVTRFQFRIVKYPTAGESVTVETWASTRSNGIRAVREFRILTSDGSLIGDAKSLWLLLDAARKRPVRLPQIIADISNPERSDLSEFEYPRLHAPTNPSVAKTFEVGWKELDVNHHANNVNYIDWALEALPIKLRNSQTLSQLDIEYLSEAFYGDQITSEVELGESVNSHQLKNASGKTLCLVVTQTLAQSQILENI